LVTDGTIKAQITAVGKDTVLSNILSLVKQAQAEKPPMQQFADKISAIFVPVVVGIAILTFLVNYFIVDIDRTDGFIKFISDQQKTNFAKNLWYTSRSLTLIYLSAVLLTHS